MTSMSSRPGGSAFVRMPSYTDIQNILLQPRPYAQYSGRLLLLPLLPQPKPLKPLPAELWAEIFRWVVYSEQVLRDVTTPKSLLTTCKAFKDIALPLYYSNAVFTDVKKLERFFKQLHQADQKWDSIRRIPYSTPGRWVQTLDFSNLMFTSQTQALQLDSILTALFPLVPFIIRFSMNPSFVLSRRALRSLADRDGAAHLRFLDGISYVPPHPSIPMRDDPLVTILRACPNLEELEVVGHGPDPAELEFFLDSVWTLNTDTEKNIFPLDLPKLQTLTLLSMYTSPLMANLLYSPLPSLRKLTVTPYADLLYPTSLVSQFIETHGTNLRSLLMYTPKSWPTRLHPSPNTLLQTSPNMRHLSLENPVPKLQLAEVHPLQIISIPRPTPESWGLLESMFTRLPRLQIVRIRDVRWLRKGMNSRAQEAGVQGEMREWRRHLMRRRIRVLDADWNDQD